MGEMSRTEKAVNLGAVVVPFAATLVAIVLLWNSWVSAVDLVIAAAMYLLTAIGITVGFHRLLTHRSFQTSKPLEYLFAVFGSMAVQGPVIAWVADHRKHHAHTDEEGDPHSPHVSPEGGVKGVFSGLWHAHSGWLMSSQGRADWKRYAADLYEDRGMRTISRQFPLLVLATLLIPALAGYLASGTLVGALTGLLWGAWFASSSFTTSPGASTPFATSSAADALTRTIIRPMSFGWPFLHSVSRGITITMPSPVRRCTD